VRMIGASCGPDGDYAIDQCVEPMTFRDEVSFIEHHEARDGWRISPHGRVVTECLGFDEAADEPPDQQARRKYVAQSLLHTLAAVGYGLRGIHLAPLALAVGT
jgi:hypothetical protein